VLFLVLMFCFVIIILSLLRQTKAAHKYNEHKQLKYTT